MRVYVDCSSTSIAGTYLYTLPASGPLETVIPVSCATGYVWSSAPTAGAYNATCSNVLNSIWHRTDTLTGVSPGKVMCIFANFISKSQ